MWSSDVQCANGDRAKEYTVEGASEIFEVAEGGCSLTLEGIRGHMLVGREVQ